MNTPTAFKFAHGSPGMEIVISLFASAAVFAVFLLQSHTGFSLLDEGFLWYGAQRVMAGEVPIRDFMAYDIGRYYWSAAFMRLAGDDGIVILRVASAAFQAIAFSAGLILLARNSSRQHNLFLLLAGITLTAWMSIQFRLYDVSMPILLTGVLSFLIERPSTHRYFLVGFVVGLAAVFGRNHGVYGIAGSLGVMTFLAIRSGMGANPLAAFAHWGLGIVAGYLPVLVCIAAVPDFAPAFWQSIRLLFEIGDTNFPLPIPWPWLIPFDRLSAFNAIRGVLVGSYFLAIPAFGLLGIGWAIRQRLRNGPVPPVMVAAAFLALPYAHYAYSRADLSHLSLGVPPLLMGILALLANQPARIKWPFAGLLCLTGMVVMFPAHPLWQCHAGTSCIETNVATDRLLVDAETANQLDALHKLSKLYANNGRSFIAAPFWPGAYAALRQKSPLWEVYALFPRDSSFQQAEIERIKSANPGFVLIIDFPLDGKEELRFRNTHPLLDQYIRDHFERLEGYTRNPMYQLYRSRQAPE